MQKKVIVLGISLLLGIAILVWSFGFFPIARVDGEYIWYRSYEGRISAFMMFEEQSRQVISGGNMTPVVLHDIQRAVLDGLITEKVFHQYIDDHSALAGVRDRAENAVSSTLKNADPNILPEATKQLYGWSVEEFSDNILYPQALQNELTVFIEQNGTSFEEFARTQLSSAAVQLYGVPWRWENGGLVEK